MNVLSDLDLPKVRSAIEALSRTIDNPSSSNPIASQIYRLVTKHSTSGEQNPEGVSAQGLINVDRDRVNDAICGADRPNYGHSRSECPEITGSSVSPAIQLALLDVRTLINGVLFGFFAATPNGRLQSLSVLQAALNELNSESILPRYVTLDQMAAMVNRNKRTLEKRISRKKNPLPNPEIQGGGGKPSEWIWEQIRPWLEAEFNRQLPASFPVRQL